jgi:signal peptidase II
MGAEVGEADSVGWRGVVRFGGERVASDAAKRGDSKSFMYSVLRSPAAICRFFLTAGIGVSLDLWTKWLAFSKLDFASGPYRFIPGWLEFEVIGNHGAVFGSLQGFRMLFLTASVGASAFLIYLFLGSGKKWFYQILLGMLWAGVLGNLYDRVTLGYVRDMIHALPRWPHFFPWVFNVADTLLCVGVGAMILHSFFTAQNVDEAASVNPAPRTSR